MALNVGRGLKTQSARRYLQLGGIFIGLVLLGVYLSFASPYFLTQRNILNILLQASTIGILAAGLTVVLIAREIDLSIGSLEGLAGVVAAVLIIQQGLPVAVGLPVALLAALGAGMLSGYITVFARVPSFIVTLAMLGIAHGAALLLTGGRPLVGFPAEYAWLGQGRIWGVPVPVIIAGMVYIFIHILLSKTRTGIAIYATGGGRDAAELAGIRTGRIIITALAISGLLSGLAGVILAARLGAGNGDFGSGDLLDAIAAVVIGGTSLMGGIGTVVGTIGGVLIIATLRNGLVLLSVQTFWQEIAVGSIILASVFIDQIAKGHVRLSDLLPTSRSSSAHKVPKSSAPTVEIKKK